MKMEGMLPGLLHFLGVVIVAALNRGDAVADKYALLALQGFPRLRSFHALAQYRLLAVNEDFGKEGVAAVDEKHGFFAFVKAFANFPNAHTIVQGIAPLITVGRQASVLVAVAAHKPANGGMGAGGNHQQANHHHGGNRKCYIFLFHVV